MLVLLVFGLGALGQADLVQVRQVNLNHAAKMPNFIADETAVQYDSDRGAGPPVWSKLDTIESEVVYVNGRMRRQNQRRDGQAADKLYELANGGFGIEIKPLLDPSCPTTIEFESSAGGKTWFRFRSPADACFVALGIGQGTGHRVARTGRFLADDLTRDLIRYEEEGHGFPKDYSMQQRNEIVAFEYVKIADASYLLPVSAEFWWKYLSDKPRRTVITYKNYRHFEASTKIAFQ
jgi:hypothetical protein